MSSFDRLLEQIDAFIRKYYKNQMIKGLIWFIGIFLSTFLIVTTLEYIGRFNSIIRGLLFFSFIGINIYVLVRYFVIPLLKLNSYGQRIDRYQAATIIGSFFPNISDRLVNTLQLSNDLNTQEGNIELLRASVAQRSETLSVVPFSTAIDFKENKKYIKLVLPLFLLFLIIGLFVPSLFKQGTERIVNYNQTFIIPAPFTFILNGYQSQIEEGLDLPIDLILEGNDLPEKVYVVGDNGKHLLEKVEKNHFKGSITRVSKDGSFYFLANEFTSNQFNYKVIGKVALGKLEAELQYPAYLGKQKEIITNAGDFSIPEGTQITWSVRTKNTSEVIVKISDSLQKFYDEGFKINRRFIENSDVQIILKSKFSNSIDSLQFNIQTIKDAHPIIDVVQEEDSIHFGRKFFSGNIGDDYGLTSLNFVYIIKSKDGNERSEKIRVQPVSGTKIPFNFAVDFAQEKLKLDDVIEYYFVVSDNDGVNGSKSSISRRFTHKLPNLEELNEKFDEDQTKARNELDNLLDKAKEFEKNINKLKKELINSKSNTWNNTNSIQQLQEEHKSLLEQLEQTQELLENSIDEKSQLTEMDEELLEKQDLIEDLLDQLMDDELKKLLEDLQKLMEEQNKDKLNEKLDQLEMSSEQMKNQLDRSLEMLKKLQVDEKIDAIEEELNKLADEQEKLQKDIEQKKLTEDKGKDKQDELNEKFNQVKEDLEELHELNKNLDRPMDISETENEEKSIQDEMQNASENLEKSKSNKAGENQKSAAEQMKQLSQQLNAQQQQSNQQQQSEDMDMLRNILESLVTLSVDQEWVMNELYAINENDPSYRTFGRFQRKVIDNTIPVADSLNALAKRQPKIASFVDQELQIIRSNQKISLEDIDERRKRDLATHQQYAMTSYNNLALMLNESLQQMQQQMQNMKEGSGSCNNPGGKGKPKPGSSSNPGDMKEALKKQLEQMKKGQSPGGNKPGEKPGQNGSFGLGNKEVAKMAAEQGAIRRQLEQLRNELNKEGQGLGNKLNPLINELEKQEENLVNKRFSSEMIKRQQDILTRLLESEKAIKERGFEDKRESKEGKNQNNGNLIRFDEYNKQKLKQIELLRSIDPVYNKYYKDKANQYFNSNY